MKAFALFFVLVFTQIYAQPEFQVGGIVLDEDGLPLNGAIVTLAMHRISDTTNSLGEFSLGKKDSSGVSVQSLLNANSAPVLSGRSIDFALSLPKFVRIDIYSLSGKHIESLVRKKFGAGHYSIPVPDICFNSGAILIQTHIGENLFWNRLGAASAGRGLERSSSTAKRGAIHSSAALDTLIVSHALHHQLLVEVPDSPAYLTIKMKRLDARPVVKGMEDTAVSINDSIILHATGYDDNGIIKHFQWSFDGQIWVTTEDSLFVTSWSRSEFGRKEVMVRAMDDGDNLSKPDTIIVTVNLYPPTVLALGPLGPLKDTVLAWKDSLFVAISARDTNGTIRDYLWDYGADGWDDSLTGADSFSRNIKWPAGGQLSMAVGAIDDDGILASDTFSILFSRPPIACDMKFGENPDRNGWNSFDYGSGKGAVNASLSGSDLDGVNDVLSYQVFWGRLPDSLTRVYSGTGPTVVLNDIDTVSDYYWKVVVKDRLGDSIYNTGSFNSNGVPSAGYFWNRISGTSDFKVPNINGNVLQANAFSHGGKMWFVSSSQIAGFNWVYSSTDGITWQLVTKSADFQLPNINGSVLQVNAFSHGGRMWLVSSSQIAGFNWVYSSTDGITWQLVTKSADFQLPGINSEILQVNAFSHGGKMWLVSSTQIAGFNWVYSSTDGITWQLVTKSADFQIPGINSAILQVNSFSHDGKMWLVSSSQSAEYNWVFRSGQ